MGLLSVRVLAFLLLVSGCGIALVSCTNNAGSLQTVSAENQRQSVLSRLSDRISSQDRDNEQSAIASLRIPKERPNGAFEPNVRPLLKPQFTTSSPTDLSTNTQVATASTTSSPPIPNRRAVLEETAPPTGNLRGLDRFQAKLAALKSGRRTKPVIILHIGDSHVASDSFSQGIRRALQADYGNAGRGATIPARAFKYGVADKVRLKANGSWYAQTALISKSGPFGISGASVSSRSSRASMVLESRDGPFDWAEATVLTGPSQGAFYLKVGNTKKRFDAWSKKRGSKTFRLSAKGSKLQLNPAGGGRTTVLNWSTGRNAPGIRYVNFGLIGATVTITRRFDDTLIANDIRAIDPDLIVYGFGTNEGFNDNLDLKRYASFAKKFVTKLQKAAPEADVVYIGAASGLRRKARGGRSCGGGWYEPRRLNPLRTKMKEVARQTGAAYWDWSKAMGGPCSINGWAGKGMAARDRVHLTSRGYKQSAKSFAKWLKTHKQSGLKVALQNN